MNEEKSAESQNSMQECAAQLSSAAQTLERVIGKLEAQYEALNQKIDRIIATVEKQAKDEVEDKVAASSELTKLETENRELRQRAGRKTVAPLVNRLLAKSGVGEGVQIEAGTLEKALGGLNVEQRMAVKAELARAGMLA
jgi:DNA repair exonuclease SbcCD ATPase subunit